MGLSSMPAPKDSLLGYLLYNTAVSIAILSGLVRAAMAFLGLPVPPAWEDGAGDDNSHNYNQHPASAAAASSASASVSASVSSGAGAGAGAAGRPTLADRFRSSFRPALFGRRRGAAADCRVCLARFEAESVVNRLPCGHLFHRACLETWLNYDHATCPLCRLRLLPADEPPLARRVVRA